MLLVEHNAVARTVTASRLQSAGHHVEACGTVTSSIVALARACERGDSHLDVVVTEILLDVRNTGDGGDAATIAGALRAMGQRCAIVLCSSQPEHMLARAHLAVGPVRTVRKDEDGTALLSAVADAVDLARAARCRGTNPSRPAVALETLCCATPQAIATTRQIAESIDLTLMEQLVLTLRMSGRGLERVADDLLISRSTVKFHVRNVLRKVGAESVGSLMTHTRHGSNRSPP